MSSFAIKYPFFILMLCLIVVVGVTTVARMPVDLFPEINIPVVVVATFYSGMPPQQIESDITDTFERFFTLGSGHRPHRIPLTDRRQPDQNLFPAGHGCQCGGQRHLESGHGEPAPFAARNLAARGVEVRCLQPAGLPGHAKRPGTERNAAQRSCAVHRPQPDGECARCFGAATLMAESTGKSMFYIDPVKLEATQMSLDGRSAFAQRIESDSARRRRADWPKGLQHLHEQPIACRR